MKKYWIRLCLVVLALFAGLAVWAQPQSIEYSRFLRNTVETNDNFWIRVHAAEALLDNNFPVDVENIFHAQLHSEGEEKIGALRMLARTCNDTAKVDSIAEVILERFRTTQSEHEKLVALETLGKLGYYTSDAQIRELSEKGAGRLKDMALWVMANSGNAKDLNALADNLVNEDSIQFRDAAYALRFFDEITPGVYRKMKDKFEALDKAHRFRVYLLSALYVHASDEDLPFLKEQLLAYANGKQNEKIELFYALAEKGEKKDISIITAKFQNEENTDVKISVANAFLSNEHYLQSRVGWIDWVVLTIYAFFVLGIGWYYSRFQKNKEDYFLGGRNVGAFSSGISLFVSFFSAISYLAIAGEVVKNGPLIALIVVFSAPVIYLLGSYFLIPFFMNLKIISAYEILEKPLGAKVRRIGSVLFILTRLVWMALLIFLAAKAMVVMMGWNENAILLITIIIGIITVVYTSMGGIRAVLLTDVIQFFILLLGAILTILIIGIKFGGEVSLIPETWSQNWAKIDFMSFNPYVRLTIVTSFIDQISWWICTTGSDQMAIQRFLTTKNLKSARRSFLVTQVGQMITYVLLLLVGFAIYQFYKYSPNLLPKGTNAFIDSDFLFPHFIANQFPVGMSGLIIAALFSASMSSLSSGVNSVASVFSADILSVFRKNFSIDNLRTIKIISSITGAVVIALSLIIPLIPGNVIELTYKTNGLFIAPLFNMFFMALFIKKAKPFGVVIGSVYGFFAAFVIAFWDVLTGNPAWSFLWIGFSSFIVSVLVSIVFSLLLPNVKGRKALLWGALLLVPWAPFFIGYI